MSIKNYLHHQHKSPTNQLFSIILAIFSIHISSNSVADNVKVYNHVPSANEMATLLFPKTSEQPPVKKRIKMRSISFAPLESSSQHGEKSDLTAISEHLPKSVGISLPIQFDFNSDSIPRVSRSYIDEIGKMLSDKDFLNEVVVIEGHTDANGRALYNKQLSLKRAQSIKHYLFYQFGIAPDRMMVSGKGEFQPLIGQNPFDAVNRRVEIHKFQ